jgi:hypothetical protein
MYYFPHLGTKIETPAMEKLHLAQGIIRYRRQVSHSPLRNRYFQACAPAMLESGEETTHNADMPFHETKETLASVSFAFLFTLTQEEQV